jgi:hypothetical protein
MRYPRRSLPAVPADALGFLTTRHDRPERLALYRSNGDLAVTFAYDDTPAGIAARGLSDGAPLRLEAVPDHHRMWLLFPA